jgi:RNA recognition motif-containing protein
MKIKVSGFPGITSKEEIRRVFSKFGTITKIEKEFRKSVAYVTMPYDYQAQKAILALNGTKILGRTIEVMECF